MMLLTGLILMVSRETAGIGLALGVHLGGVFAQFLTMPYESSCMACTGWPSDTLCAGAAS